MVPKTPVFKIIALCTAHTPMAISSLFSSTHMVRTLPLEITLQLCSPYSPGSTMGYWHGHSLERFIFQFEINSTPRISGLSYSHPARRCLSEGLLEKCNRNSKVFLKFTIIWVFWTKSHFFHETQIFSHSAKLAKIGVDIVYIDIFCGKKSFLRIYWNVSVEDHQCFSLAKK